MRTLLFLFTACALVACGGGGDQGGDAPADTAEPAADAAPAGPDPDSPSARLENVLASQPAEVRDRYPFRHPQATLEFFGIEPGMTVVEALPGGGWYTKILLPYLGPEGRLIGADYALDMYRNFDFGTDEFIANKRTWTTDWPAEARGWAGEDAAAVDAFVFGNLPADMHGTADAVLIIRALHNLARFEDDGGYLTQALDDAFAVLKPGGIAGVVQHHARDDMPDSWASGENGYLKESFVITAMQSAGFELVDSSDINANPADRPTTEDIVWRLPPSLGTSEADTDLRAQLEAIGESNRMTLLFRKPRPAN
ncbi:MAG: methyltransferase [Woeseiaceae bacterium]|nr:methyltransferase [Woeseiaceae bacterium]